MHNIYLDNIIDLYKNPLNAGTLDSPSVSYWAYNPLCGDEVAVDIKVIKESIAEVKHRSVRCAISQASISLITEHIKGKTMDTVMAMKPGEVTQMLGITLSPVRLKCALLGLEAIHEAIAQYKKSSSSPPSL